MPDILVLDSSPDFLQILGLILNREGFKVSTCSTIQALFSNLQQAIPDLLMLDVMHGQVDAQVIREDLRTRNALKTIPIIITSAKPEQVNSYTDFGADDALQKPFDMHEMINKVRLLVWPKLPAEQ